MGKEFACNAGDVGSIPGWERSLEKEMATHSSILAWRIPWLEELGRLQTMGAQRVRHDWVSKALSLSFLRKRATSGPGGGPEASTSEGKRGKLAGVEKILLTSQNALRLASDRENTPVPPCSLLVSVSLLFIIFGGAGSHCPALAFSSCGGRTSHCSSFSCCRAQILGCQALTAAARGL